MGRLAAILAKLGVSAALIWYAFSKIDVHAAFSQMAALAPAAGVAAVATILLHYAVASLRVCQLLASVGRPMRFPASFDTVLVGAFFSQTLISFVGGDAMRIWRMTQKGIPVDDSARVVLYDRVLGFLGLIVMIVFALPILFHVVEDRRVHAAILLFVAAAVVGLLVMLSLRRLPTAWTRHRLVAFAVKLSQMGHELLRAPRLIAILLGLSVAIQILNTLVFFLFGRGIGVQVEFTTYLALVPPVIFLSMMPISFAGWGVRESALIALLSTVGVPAAQSVAISVCYGLGLILASLPGGIMWLYVWNSSKRSAAT